MSYKEVSRYRAWAKRTAGEVVFGLGIMTSAAGLGNMAYHAVTAPDSPPSQEQLTQTSEKGSNDIDIPLTVIGLVTVLSCVWYKFEKDFEKRELEEMGFTEISQRDIGRKREIIDIPMRSQ